jgi:hypothetical protein
VRLRSEEANVVRGEGEGGGERNCWRSVGSVRLSWADGMTGSADRLSSSAGQRWACDHGVFWQVFGRDGWGLADFLTRDGLWW